MNNPSKPKNEAASTGGCQEGNADLIPARLGGNQESGSAPLSNTAPAKYISSDSGTQILRCGVDSLYLSYRGSLRTEVELCLDRLKALAKSDEAAEKAQAVYEVGNHCFEVFGGGRGWFPFVIKDNWFNLQLSRSTTTRLPLAMVQISSEVLTRAGLQASIAAADAVIHQLGRVDAPANLSRVDLCVDFQTDVVLERIPRDTWATRSQLFQQYWKQEQYSGCVFGQGGDMSCRLYNKTLEIETSGKTYLFDIWKNAGWKDDSPVWRLEFQFKRSVLRELNVLTANQLALNLKGLWKYATESWLRLLLPSADTNRARWPNHSLWCVLSDQPWGDTTHEALYRVSKSRVPSDERLFVQGLGPVTSFMARENILDIDQGFDEFKKQAHLFHRRRSQQSDQTLPSYVREKVTGKSRKYNQLFDPQYAQDRADAYLKAKEGE
jgi:hypothetical protein